MREKLLEISTFQKHISVTEINVTQPTAASKLVRQSYKKPLKMIPTIVWYLFTTLKS